LASGFVLPDITGRGLAPMTLDEKIAQASRHVENGRRIIEHQREIVARSKSRFAADLLKRFERTQQIFEMDLADLLKGK
jgi:hypothetical protein